MSKSDKDRKKHGRNGKDYQRRSPSRKPQKSFLLVVEGETEELYFKKYKDDARSNLIDIHIDNPGGTDPGTLVNRAMELKQRMEREAKRSEFVVQYEEVWVVYDLEDPHHIRREQSDRVKQRADTKENNIQFAISDPSFEYWYILHFERTTKSFNDANEIEKYLKQLWNGYKKATPPPRHVYEKTSTAIENAKWVRKELAKSNSIAPKTDVDFLVVKLIESISVRNPNKPSASTN